MRGTMEYKEIKIFPPEEELEQVELILAEHGVFIYSVEAAVIAEDILAQRDRYRWDYISQKMLSQGRNPASVTFYPEEEVTAIELLKIVEERGWKVKVTTVKEEDWCNTYKEHFHTLKLTDTITVCPSWEVDKQHAMDKSKGDIALNLKKKFIELDPGMAFGTGDHETTAMCAQLMESVGCQDKIVLDIGTGSGILAIAAVILGSTMVYGVDIDETAIQVAMDNVEKNGCSKRVTILMSDMTGGLAVRGDIIVANLVAELIVKLSANLWKNLNPGGSFICSGILLEKEEMVIKALEENGFLIKEVRRSGQWCAVEATYA